MQKQKTLKELLAESSKVVKDKFKREVVTTPDGKFTKTIAPETYKKETKSSGFVVRNLMRGEIKRIDKLISILNFCGYTVDEIVISKIEK